MTTIIIKEKFNCIQDLPELPYNYYHSYSNDNKIMRIKSCDFKTIETPPKDFENFIIKIFNNKYDNTLLEELQNTYNNNIISVLSNNKKYCKYVDRMDKYLFFGTIKNINDLYDYVIDIDNFNNVLYLTLLKIHYLEQTKICISNYSISSNDDRKYNFMFDYIFKDLLSYEYHFTLINKNIDINDELENLKKENKELKDKIATLEKKY
jgi:hypothetical protein